MRFNKKSPLKSDKKSPPKAHKKGVVGYNKKTALLEEAITHMNEGKYGRSSAALKELLALDPLNTEARRLFATLHLRLGSLISARTAFESLAREALERQDFWLAESLLREYLTAGPRCVPFLDMLGQVYEQKGDSMAAVAEYGKAIDVLIEDQDPDHPSRAADLFAKIRSLAPGSPVAFRLGSLFDSRTGELLPSSITSSQHPTTEEERPATVLLSEDAGDPAGLSSGPLEQLEKPADLTAQPETPAASSEPSEERLPEALSNPVSVGTIEPQAVETSGGPIAEDQVGTGTCDEGSPPVPPATEGLHNHADLPFKLAEETTTAPTQPIASEAEVEQTPPAALGTMDLSVAQEPGSLESDQTIAVPDLSLQEVTQPIAEAPSAPLPMPWDQVQDTTLSIPLPSGEAGGVQAPDIPDLNERDAAPIPEPPGMPDDQPVLPVQSESLLSSLSWEEILAAVGKGAEPLPDPEPAPPVAPHEQIDPTPTPSPSHQASLDHPHELVLTPISEPVTEPQALPVPMPWERVEEEPVPILQHEPEPEFGVVPENTLTPFIDDTLSPHPSDTGVESVDETVRMPDVVTAPAASSPLQLQEQPSEQSNDQANDQAGDQSRDQAGPASCTSEEAPSVSTVALEPPATEPEIQSAIQSAACEPSLPVTEDAAPAMDESAGAPQGETETASACKPSKDQLQGRHLSLAQQAESLDIESGPEPARTEPVRIESPVEESDSLVDAPEPPPAAPAIPAVHLAADVEPLPAASFSPETPPRHEEPASSPGRTAEVDPSPVAADDATAGEVKILWDEQAQQPALEAAGSGLLSRWLLRPKPDQSVAAESSAMAGHEASTGSSAPVEASLSEPTAFSMSAMDVPVGHSGPSLPARSDEKPAKRKVRKQLVGRVSSRIRLGVVGLIGTCFSTTRSVIVSLVVLGMAIVAVGVLGLGVAGLAWVLMEERPNTAFHNLSATPQRTLQEASTNGYLMLLGFDRGTNQDPAQAGLERRFEKSDLAITRACLTSSRERQSGDRATVGSMPAAWYQDQDPAARFRVQAASVRAWGDQADRSMARYKQWLKMPFEDWGYGEPMSPNCPVVLHAHRLYVANGFTQDIESGVERLEVDLAMWRKVLSHAKSLSTKMLATDAVNDDVTILSGLLARPDLEERLVGRLGKLARPLDQVEQSLRWPMQSELAAAAKIQDMILKQDSSEPVPLYVSLVSQMPLPKQKRFNLYADYYEASSKAAPEGRFASLPKRVSFVRYPAESWIDYGMNPIENIVGVPPLPEWETYGGRILELDARLRLAGLQAWIRRSPQEQDVLTRIAKAGQTLYDPFTGFPMLVNRRKGLIYSVGQDGKDHDGQSGLDIAAMIPSMPGGSLQDGKRGASAAKSR